MSIYFYQDVILIKDTQIAFDQQCCCNAICCCPGMIAFDPITFAELELAWAVTSDCGLSGDLLHDSVTSGCEYNPPEGKTWTSEMKSIGNCGAPIPVRFHLTCKPDKDKPEVCLKYELTADWGNSGCSGADRGPWEPEEGCDCDPFYLVFKIPCPQGVSASCLCSSGTITVIVTKV